jgi:hypothetical protein
VADEERLFDVEQAEKLLPTIAALLESARQSKLQADSIEREFAQMSNRILLYGGIVPPYAHLAERRLERESLVQAIREAVGRIEQAGCVVKDIDMGLVDFPSVVDDEQVYLCWKLGEKRIRFWHRTDEGYASRKPLGREGREEPPGERKPN